MPDAAREALEMIKRRATEAGGNVYGDLAEAALTQSPLPREGEWVTVPRELTMAMFDASFKAGTMRAGSDLSSFEIEQACYAAMLAAAPPSPEVEAELKVPLTLGMARAQADLYLDMKARAEAAESSRDDLLRQLEEAKGEVERLKNELAHEGEHQRQCAVEWFNKFRAAEAQRDALLEAQQAVIDESIFNQQRFAEDTDTDYFLRCFKAVKDHLRTAHEAAAHNTGEADQ